MPTIRRRLTRAEQDGHLVRAEQLRASGVKIEILEEWRERNRALDIIVASPAACRVFESCVGGTFYVACVRLLARSAFVLADCDITTELDDQIVMQSFLDPVCNHGGEQYSQREVLNHRIEKGLRLSRNDVVEGYILASGMRRLPPEYGKFVVPFKIVLSDQFGCKFSADGEFSVSRRVQRVNSSVARGTGLYGPADNQQSCELSVGEESGRRYVELLAQEKKMQSGKASGPVAGDLR